MSNGGFCKNCGEQLQPGERFCSSCGAQNASVPDPGPSYGGGNEAYQPKKKPPYAAIGIVVAAVVVIGLIAMFFLGSSIKPEELKGDWKGTITITSIDGDKELTGEMNAPSKLPYEEKVNCSLTLDSSGKGKMNDSSLEYTADYSRGKLNISAKEDNPIMSMTVDGVLKADKDKTNYTLDGEIKMTVKDSNKKTATLKGTYKLTKPLK